MFYQKLLTENTPYVASVSSLGCFGAHRHHELEMLYCIAGGFDIRIENRPYNVAAGEAVFVGSMLSHEIGRTMPDSTVLLIEIGPLFLREHFSKLARCSFPCPLYRLDMYRNLRELLDETAGECTKNSGTSDLRITGNLYKICAFILDNLPDVTQVNGDRKNELRTITDIDKALELVYFHYREPITVEYAASLTGYGKSNFCKMFKNSVGMSFHAFLNNFRIKNAKYLLCENESTVGEIALMVGFSDSKTFCRVFKSLTGTTPGQYRDSRKTG